MRRRGVITCGAAGVLAATTVARRSWLAVVARQPAPPVWSTAPVVGDGRWIEAEPPRGVRGHFDQRPFELTVGIEMQGRGHATDVRAATTVPVAHPEQAIADVRVETIGCEARIQSVGEGAAQLVVAAAAIGKDMKLHATARYRLNVAKSYCGHERDRFPRLQPRPTADVRGRYLLDSPGIQTGSAEVRRLLDKVRAASDEHPWDVARRCWAWVRENIRPRIGSYTSVVRAIEDRVGDCEEMAGVFVALCRRAGIPARLVWVPNHCWAEFHLVDEAGAGHWIPAHTACYPWFGWTGVHELVLQKGDRVVPVQSRSPQRLLEDWGRAVGPLPAFRWTAVLTPLPAASGDDPGPGGRVKQPSGEWRLAGHPLDSCLRRE